MITILLGGIGSGKSLSAVKSIIDRRMFAITNFRLKHRRGQYHRLKFSDIITTDKKTKKKSVNWQFWKDMREKHKYFSIYLDEVHNIIHARRSMTKTNVLMSKWVSQVRKICADSPYNHLFLISQTIRKIDIDFRELAHEIIVCKKFEVGKNVWIRMYIYDSLDDYMNGIRKKGFYTYLANRYFKYYNTNEMVVFEDGEEFV